DTEWADRTGALSLLFILLLVILVYIWHKLRKMRDDVKSQEEKTSSGKVFDILFKNRSKKKVQDAVTGIRKAFELLKKDVHRQIDRLENIRQKNTFTKKEEQEIIEQLNRDLDEAEKFIKQEIREIKKRLK
ncbi:MAG: hypothetical protein V1760_01575, partial [Candidatus Peregrinibacteria bacterium]